jgi:hypothetical protein
VKDSTISAARRADETEIGEVARRYLPAAYAIQHALRRSVCSTQAPFNMLPPPDRFRATGTLDAWRAVGTPQEMTDGRGDFAWSAE